MLAFLPAFLAPSAPPQQISLAPDAEAQWIPFELTAGNQIRFAMTVNGVAGQAVLDTGVTDSFVTAAFARRADVQVRRRETATAIGGQVQLGWADRATLMLGALTRSDAPLAVTSAADLERFGADIFIGADIAACCALDIDYDARRFRFLPSGRMPFTGATAPLSRARSGLMLSEVALNGQRLRPIVVDTGDGSSLTLTRSAWQSAGLGDVPLTTTLGWGMGGAAVTDMAVVPDLVLAGTAVREAELRVEPADGFAAQTGSAGRIGTGLLLRFRVLIDPGARRMVLQPGKAFAAAVPRSTSGLLMAYEPGRLRVLHVMRNSPAAEAGWRDGDVICRVDDRPVSTGAGAIGWGASAPGRTVRLTLCGGAARALTLRRFY
jgi:predicted aspartyl protease